MWGIPWLDLKSHLLRCLVFLYIAYSPDIEGWCEQRIMSNNLQESLLPCVFSKLMPDGKVNDHSLVSKFHLNVSSHFKQKEHLHFLAKRVCSYLLSVFVVYHSWFSIVFTMNPPVSWASSSVLLVCSCQTLPDFWVFFLCSCQVSRLQPPFAASGHLVLCLCVTPVQTFSLVVGPHGKGHQNILLMHCICEDIKSCMHFMTLKILDSCLPNVELAERLTWEIHRQEEERNPSSNWIENHVDYYLLSQAGWRSAENQIFLTHSLPVTVIFAWANFHSASKSCITFLLQWYMFSAVSVNKISPWVVESFSPYSSFSPQCPLHLSDQISLVP
jgi:hypothetical protein